MVLVYQFSRIFVQIRSVSYVENKRVDQAVISQYCIYFFYKNQEKILVFIIPQIPTPSYVNHKLE
jgi:hypothetical protein